MGETINGTPRTEPRLDTSFNEYYDIASGLSQSHDPNGNLTLGALPSEPTQTYQWDAFNRLRKVYEGMTLLAEHQYNAGHRCMGRTPWQDSPTRISEEP